MTGDELAKEKKEPLASSPSTLPRFPPQPPVRKEKKNAAVEWKRKSCVTAGKTWLIISFLSFGEGQPGLQEKIPAARTSFLSWEPIIKKEKTAIWPPQEDSFGLIAASNYIS